MTRPTILDLDLVVVPMEPNGDMRFAMDTDLPFTAYTEMLSASPYPTAWDDVRRYVEGLERERDEATETLRYCEKQWSDDRGVMIDKFVYERNRAEAAEARAEAAEAARQKAHDVMVKAGSKYLQAKIEAARLRALLAEAREVVERVPPYLADMYKAICRGDEAAGRAFMQKDEFAQTASALAEKLEKEIGNE